MVSEKPITFGGMFPSPVTIDEFVMYAARYLPTLVAAQVSVEPTPELVSALAPCLTDTRTGPCLQAQLERTVSVEKNPEEFRYVYCQSPGFVNLVRFGPSVDRDRVREIQDALCRLNAQKLVEELRLAFDYDGFIKQVRRLSVRYILELEDVYFQYTGVYPNSNTTLLDVFLAQRELTDTVRERIQVWTDMISKEKIDWTPVQQAWQERQKMFRDAMG